MRTKPLVTSIMAATMVLTPVLPMLGAHAQTWQYQRTSVEVNGNQVSTPDRIVFDNTTYMPIYYVDNLLQSLGFSASWNGTAHIWTLSNGQSAPSLSLDAKTGNTTISVNGANVATRISIVQAKDPESGVVTTFMPIWYVQQILNALGFTTDTWDGSTSTPTWTLAAKGQAPTSAHVSSNPVPVGVTIAEWQAAVQQAASFGSSSANIGVHYSPLETSTQWYPAPNDVFYDKSFPAGDLVNGKVLQNNPRVIVSAIDGVSSAGDPYVYVLEYVGKYNSPVSGMTTVWRSEQVDIKTGQAQGVVPNLTTYPTFEYKKLTPVSGQGFDFGTKDPPNPTWASGAGMYVVPKPDWSPIQ